MGSAETPKPVLLTPGDPAGIGAEIALKAFQSGSRQFCIIENAERLSALAHHLKLAISIEIIDHPAAFQADFPALQVLDMEWPVAPMAGHPDPANAHKVIAAIEQGARWAQEGTVAALTTNPIAKATLYDAGFTYPGHTEFLGSLAPVISGGPVMMLACESLRVVPLTIHIPLAQVPQALSTKLIVEKARLIADALKTYFGAAKPRLALCGLNPHAGERGAMGSEDESIIAPAITILRDEGIDASGPHPADTLFHEDARRTYDVALGMYHDQVLIPLKTIDFFGGVNITLGLDFIRTSPDHGTGFDIAGTGKARPDSLIAALETAQKMARTRSTGVNRPAP